MIPWLAPGEPEFPPTDQALDEPAGLLAAGGELSPIWLTAAYRRGIFPWYDDESPLLWWSPAPRMVLRPQQLHVSRSLRKEWRKANLSIRFDTDFEQVITQCSQLRKAEGTWIVDDMVQAYTDMHRLGLAHSVECWQGDQLVGGLYGIAIGKMFFGESMFSKAPNMSKFALLALARHTEAWGFAAIDCQMHTDHLQSMGAQLIDRDAFNTLLASCDAVSSTDWQYDAELMYV